MTHFTSVFQGYFIQRSGDEKQRLKQVEDLAAEQRKTQDAEEDFGPLCIFPEAACSNGLYLGKFRKGAFYGELAV